jgi:threonine dehydrogenase-like Zn-dependent dehydrogenase
MTELMTAAVFQGAGKIVIDQVAVPEIGRGDVLAKVLAVGICGSDLHSYRVGAYVQPGQIMGHEWVGVITAAGQDVEGFKEGDRIAAFNVGICGKCASCLRGEFGLCPEIFRNSTAYGRPGAFAEYIRVDDVAAETTIIHKVPDGMEDEVAATIEPTSVGTFTVKHAGVKEGDRVVVIGAGMIGNVCIQAAQAAGAGQVVAIDVSPLRLEVARSVGADDIFDASGGDPLEWVKQVVGVCPYHFGEGGNADVVIEAAGVPSTMQQALEMVRSGGTVAVVALPEALSPIDLTKIVHKQPRIVGAFGGDFASSIALLADGRIDTRPLITHRFPLEQAPEAFEAQLRPGEAMKVLIKP